MDYTINVKGRLMSLAEPQVMGIMNVTPNSFYAASRVQTEEAIRGRVEQIKREGATIIDVGACSTNPFLERLTTEEEELAQLDMALAIMRDMGNDLPVSIDTFRPKVAQMCIEKYGVDIINDISTGEDPAMFPLVAKTGTPYILMSQKGTLHDILIEFAAKVQQLRDLGQKDIILDPGFGFGKTMEQNFTLLDQTDCFSVMELPVLVGISRKRMIYQTLGITADESLNGTTVLNTMALMRGASILRVHDVREAVQAVELYKKLKGSGS
ncbi:MAG: dihydropteroate synthase [Prevotella sp.]|nr:dihydropteroate synthase [Prevotella sp.]